MAYGRIKASICPLFPSTLLKPAYICDYYNYWRDDIDIYLLLTVAVDQFRNRLESCAKLLDLLFSVVLFASNRLLLLALL